MRKYFGLLAVTMVMMLNGGRAQADVWFKGAPAAAFAAAKAEHKPLLLYWGAVWCPPCNELKSEVFAKPRFAEITKPLVALHIDGDEDGAQFWGEKLKISGYPTVLLFDPAGVETMRLSTVTSFEEFEAALAAGLKAGGGIDQAVERALAGKGTPSDWQLLAYFAWDQSDALAPANAPETIKKLGRLALAAPKTEGAALAAAALAAAAQATDGAAKLAADELRAEQAKLIDLVLSDKNAVRTARAVIVNYADAIVPWAVPQEGAGRNALAERWAKAAEGLGDDPTMSVDIRLSAAVPRLELFKLANKDAPVPDAIKKQVRTAAARADREAKSAYDRKSVISSAAWMLREAGDFAAARQLLDKELSKTDTPWYYQGSYANLEKAAGNEAAALAWAAKARQSVQGRASKVQWIVDDLVLTAAAKSAPEDRLRELTKAYYDAAIALPDGFSGRNGTRAKRVADSLKTHMADAKLRTLVETYVARCGELAPKSPGAEQCVKHFAGLLSGA